MKTQTVHSVKQRSRLEGQPFANIAITIASAALLFLNASEVSAQIKFDPPIHTYLEAPCKQMSAGDFNGDGKTDLAVGFNGIFLTILTNNGAGSFVPFTNYNSPNAALATADFNGDNNLDIVAVGQSEIIAWLGNGDASFTPTNLNFNSYGYVDAVTTGDLNHDGNCDVTVYSGQIQVYLGMGDGSFSFPSNYTTGNTVYAIAAADFNGDTNLDLVTANYSYSSMTVIFGNADGTFSGSTNISGDFSEYHHSVAVGDFNGDGKPDLTCVNFYDRSVSVRLNSGSGVFGPDLRFVAGFGPSSVAVTDFDGDGNTDILTGPSLSILPGNGSGDFGASFTNFPSPQLGGFANQGVVVADFNGDGRPDIASTRLTNDSVSVFLNQTIAPIPLAAQLQASNSLLRLSWLDWSGYSLESTTNFPLTDGWTALTNIPTVIGGRKVVDIPTSGQRQFFRLQHY